MKIFLFMMFIQGPLRKSAMDALIDTELTGGNVEKHSHGSPGSLEIDND